MEVAGDGLAVRRAIEEARQRLKAIESCRPVPAPCEHDTARIGRCRFLDGDIEAVLRKPRRGALGPFDEHCALAQCILKTELVELARLQAVEIAMSKREMRHFVALHERESRTWHFRPAAKSRDQRAGKGGLAGTERSGQRNDVAGLESKSQTARDDVEPDEIDIVEAPTCGHPARIDL